MPELPDVEVYKQYLDATALHQQVQQVDVRDDPVVVAESPARLRSRLAQRTFEETRRHGKYLFVRLDNDDWLLMHFGMTGDLKYFKHAGDEPDYTQVLITFANAYHLAFVMPRKLGKLQVVEDMASFVREKQLGPDVMADDFDLAAFQALLDGRRGMIKSTLMNQHTMAGIGNVYSDEILFQARVYPRAQVKRLDDDAIRRLYGALREVLQTAIDCRADPDALPDSYLIPRRHEDGRCPRCGGPVERIEVSGRAGYYCPTCQAP